jgi:hypothetical protein
MERPKDMQTVKPADTREPFGKVNFWRLPDGSKQVRAYILMEKIFEGAKVGIAIDGSVSMRGAFGLKGCLGFLSQASAVNTVSPVAQEMCAYLARKAADGQAAVIYWATGNGSQLEAIGDLTAEQAKTHNFTGPKRFGGGTKLLPALKYFVERFVDAPWGMYVFITDGALHDLEAVKGYTTQLARDIEAGQRNDLKLVLIGVGNQVDKGQMQQLDDLDTGTQVDLWDHRLASEMQQVAEIFTEVVDENTIVAESGLVRDEAGNVILDCRDKGVPALLTFTLPTNSRSFTLEIAGQIVTQPIP